MKLYQIITKYQQYCHVPQQANTEHKNKADRQRNGSYNLLRSNRLVTAVGKGPTIDTA
jgi:hypothetical protein